MRLVGGIDASQLDELTLFPFDDHGIPFQHGLRLQLQPYPQGYSRPSNVVVPLGPPGTPDSRLVTYYGSVIRVGDELWMWYLGQSDRESVWHERVCFATSSDGRNWDKPELGLVDFYGSKDNNLVDLIGGRHHVTALVVFHDPDDPDPARRFKMAFESRNYETRLAVAYSPDGVRWTESTNNPVGPRMEQAGGTKFNGMYVVNGQGGRHWTPRAHGARKLISHVSYDFEHWTRASVLGFRRDALPPRDTVYGWNRGPEVHLGAGLWNRGNVVLGFYGMWNGPVSGDRRMVYMDLGLVVSNDALHFREPVPDFAIVEALEVGWRGAPLDDATVHSPALIQGQGFENIGNETLFWYAPWPEADADGVRLATWPRDRLGYVHPYVGLDEEPHLITAPIDLNGVRARVWCNVDGLSEHASMRVSVLDERFRPVNGLTREECTGPQMSGFREAVTWKSTETIPANTSLVRLQVNFAGLRPEDVRLFALYLEAIRGG